MQSTSNLIPDRCCRMFSLSLFLSLASAALHYAMRSNANRHATCRHKSIYTYMCHCKRCSRALSISSRLYKRSIGCWSASMICYFVHSRHEASYYIADVCRIYFAQKASTRKSNHIRLLANAHAHIHVYRVVCECGAADFFLFRPFQWIRFGGAHAAKTVASRIVYFKVSNRINIVGCWRRTVNLHPMNLLQLVVS